MNSVTSVTCEIRMHLLVAGGDAWAVPTTLVYSVADPYAVHATMRTPSDQVEWIFCRELLHSGLSKPVGVGDLHVAPGTDERGRPFVSIELSTPDGDAILHADAGAVSEFLANTSRAVPLGSESDHLDIDAALASLLADS